jgi:rod shape-determining protein MreD
MNHYGHPGALARFAVLLAVIVIVQGVLAFRFRIFAYLDLPLIYCIYYGFTRAKPTRAVLIGTILGLMQDSLSGVQLGTNGFSKTVVAFLAASAGSKFDVDQTITRVIALIFFTFVDSVLNLVLGGMAGAAMGGLASVSVGGLLLSAVFNTLTGLILFGYRSRPDDATA